MDQLVSACDNSLHAHGSRSTWLSNSLRLNETLNRRPSSAIDDYLLLDRDY
ncbi:hypothetical protein PLANPX_0667 [Lacipirellula parvula]|uniref:Uncharacterized protein n=1 Tax=Lacipirellula parvula TaxID=2650471 RepID=A0A5K7X3W8_9BACT|nr:hypothetical protein PLANPX_0667 [Lacipirellula parvula]